MNYTDPGLMDREIDIWDQPPNLSPFLFISGVHAQIIGVDSTSESPISAQLGQSTAWPRLLGQDVPHITHRVIIPYVAGLKGRMFILYNDVDNGPRRFDIDRIVDPDEHKHELRILAIERSDGTDPFDTMLNNTLDVRLQGCVARACVRRGQLSDLYRIALDRCRHRCRG